MTQTSAGGGWWGVITMLRHGDLLEVIDLGLALEEVCSAVP